MFDEIFGNERWPVECAKPSLKLGRKSNRGAERTSCRNEGKLDSSGATRHAMLLAQGVDNGYDISVRTRHRARFQPTKTEHCVLQKSCGGRERGANLGCCTEVLDPNGRHTVACYLGDLYAESGKILNFFLKFGIVQNF